MSTAAAAPPLPPPLLLLLILVPLALPVIALDSTTASTTTPPGLTTPVSTTTTDANNDISNNYTNGPPFVSSATTFATVSTVTDTSTANGSSMDNMDNSSTSTSSSSPDSSNTTIASDNTDTISTRLPTLSSTLLSTDMTRLPTFSSAPLSPDTTATADSPAANETIGITTPPTTPIDLHILVGSAAAAAVIAVIVTIVVIIVVRKKKQAEKPRKRMFSPEQTPLTLFDSPHLDGDMRRDPNDDATIYMNAQVKSRRIQLDELGVFVRQQTDVIKQEYKELPSGDIYPCTVAKKVENKGLNRFQNIHPYDRTRVVLPTDRTEDDDDDDDDGARYGQHGGYINASFVDGYSNKRRYIATQGPLSRTLADFWTMMWSENCSSIVMLTSFIEEGKRKCEEYYPRDRRPVTYGAVTVELVNQQSVADYAFRSLKMTKGRETRVIYHFHYLSWPDHGVPSCYAPFLTFRHKILALVKTVPGPIVVHCSAGIGRTGAYIAVDYLLDEVSATGCVDVLSAVTQLRQQRPNMVQNQDQYLFIYGAVLSGALTERYILSPHDVASHIISLDSPWLDGTTTSLCEFELVCSSSAAPPPECDVARSLAPENAHKNRDSAVLTLEPYRPFLTPSSSGGGDYINAVFCNGFRRKNEFIATQVPLSHTVDDFWRLIIDHDCENVILVHDVDTDNQYWPEKGTTMRTSLFTVESLSEWTDPEQLYTLRDFEIKTLKHPESTKRVQQCQLHFWDYGSLVPRSAQEMLSFLKTLDSWQTVAHSGNSSSSSSRTTVVQCLNGADYSGLFIAAVNLIERFKDDNEFDVFHTVEMVKMFRPQFISSKVQYLFLYSLASTSLENRY